MSRIVAFTGLAGAGKSTAAAYLVSEHGFTRTRFAGPLKAMLRALYEEARVLTHDDIERRIEGDLKEVSDPLLQGKTPRQAMQWLGTEWGRDLIGEGFWTGLWAARLASGGSYVVEDCRFANEAAVVRANGGLIVRVDCPWAGSASGNGHSSEAGGIAPDYVVENDHRGLPSHMYGQIEQILSL